jgi:hypothetical protein
VESGASDLQIQQLLEDTQALLTAVENEDTDAIGRELTARQTCVEDIKAAGGFGSLISPQRQTMIDEVLRIDKEACVKIKQLRDKSAQSLLEYRKKASGVLKYKKDPYELERGQFFNSITS